MNLVSSLPFTQRRPALMPQSFAQHTAYIDGDMNGCEKVQLHSGQTLAYTAKSPDKTVRPNEDGALMLAINDQWALLAVADGMGGHPDGDLAAQIALESVSKALKKVEPTEESVHDAVMEGFARANRDVMKEASGAGTTLIVVTLHGRTIQPFHAGDSVAIVVGQRGRLKLQTTAHSPVGYAVEAGLLDEREAINHAERHIITNFVGTPAMHVEVGKPLQLKPRDTLLIASDGLFDNMFLDEVLDAVRGSQKLNRAGVTLAAVCRERMVNPHGGFPSKPDDLTFIIHRPHVDT